MSEPVQTRLKRLEQLVTLISATTTTLSKFRNAQRFLRTTIAATQTINLPPATGKGGMYRIFTGVTATGNKVIRCNGSTDVMAGQASLTSAGTPATFGTASNTNTITLNGTTTGGIVGTILWLWDVAPGVWGVELNALASGVAATPFSNT